jgi:hypothetical protein
MADTSNGTVNRVKGVTHQTEEFDELHNRIMAHLKEGHKSARVLIVAPQLDTARGAFERVLEEGWSFQHGGGRYSIRHVDGGTVTYGSLSNPNRYYGPQWSLVIIILTPDLARLFACLDAISLGLRLGDARMVKFVSR